MLPIFGNEDMFDTVNIWIDGADLSDGSPFDILPYLSDVNEWHNTKQGYGFSGKADNYEVIVKRNGIYLKGSMAKFYLGNNIERLTRYTTKQAIERLCELLHIDLSEAKVTRLDIGTVITTKQPPKDYYQFLGTKPYFERLQTTPHTLYYNNHQKQLCFYDKTREAKVHQETIPKLYAEKHLLRYEYRYIKRLSSQMRGKVTVKMLTNKVFYRQMIDNWRVNFADIQKLKSTGFMINEITTPKEAERALFVALLQEKGQDTVEEFLVHLRANGVFSDKKYYSRLNSNLNKLLSAQSGEHNSLMSELEMKICEVANSAK